ncbi:MAG: penicillin acylase family protein, partial [Alphaproteobacteria bacterium]
VGATVPGVPFTIVGHNSNIAWGFTTTHADTQDIFIEKIDPDTPANYLTENGSVPFAVRRELIQVRGRDEPDELIVRTTRNGPVITDVSRRAEEATPEGHVLSLGFTALSPDDRSAEALFRLNIAGDWRDFVDAVRLFHAPMQNIAYADTAGNIGFYTPGRLPIRRAGDGRLPAPGWTGEYGWIGTVAFDDLPHAFNPPTGQIVNANNRLSDTNPPFIAFDWPASYRADRITERLAATPKHDAGTFAGIQTDTTTLLARSLLPTLLDLSSAITESRSHEILAHLAAWDGNMSRNQPEPIVFMAWLDALGPRLFGDELGELAEDFIQLRPRTLEHILTNRQQWCDDTTTDAVETCATQSQAAFDDALAFLTDRLGKDWQEWRWGDLHQARFRHPIFGRIPLLKNLSDRAIPSDGGSFTVNRGVYFSGQGDNAFSHIVGAGYRAIYDLSDLSRSQYMIATGQAGHLLSPFYGNLTQRWRDGEFLTIGGDKGDNPRTTLILQPAP